ncbi:MAG: M23 family metallopeptidase [Bacteroidales bacterium]|nr:M23 family metallopeptidase [Bacteroidales bacterium]
MKEQWENRWAAFRQWMRDKYQLVVRNKAFEEKFSLELSRWHVLVTAILGAILLIALTTLLIAFTPLREYIPGYGSSKQSKKMFALRLQIDSLSHQMNAYEDYVRNIQMVLNGDFSADSNAFRQEGHPKGKASANAFAFSKEDSAMLALQWQQQPEKTISVKKRQQSERHLLFQPVSGTVTIPFSTENHGITISTAGNQPLHAVENGIIFHADNQTICIQHPDNRISVYRQFQHPVVHKGEPVRSGQIIAHTRTDLTETGFEYWVDGKAVDPQSYFAFN